MRPVPKKKAPEKLSAITNRLDRLVSSIVRTRDGRCVTCGTTESPQCGHFVGRMFINTRWDLTNCHQQCAGCNMLHESDPVPYGLFIDARYGRGYPEELSRRAHMTKVLTRGERLLLEVELKAELKKLEQEKDN